MNKSIFAILGLLGTGACLQAQNASSAFTMSTQDLNGTARFMSMAGAFGALGADLSCISQNPGGIGVYRNNDIGFTVSLDPRNSKSSSGGHRETWDKTTFNLDNIGGVFTMRLNSEACPNVNFGFTYNKTANFSRRYRGSIPNLQTSYSNYLAGVANNNGLVEADVLTTPSYDPYNPPYGSPQAPWNTIMGFDGYLIDPTGDPDSPVWEGQFRKGTTGGAGFQVEERGSLDSYNIAIGGNIYNVVYWGMDFDVTSIDYRINSLYAESLRNAYVFNPLASDGQKPVQQMDALWTIGDSYRFHGSGFNFKMGLVVKPIQELRFGIAFHTPTYYNLSEDYYDNYLVYEYPFVSATDIRKGNNVVFPNNGNGAYNDYNFRTPWRVIASVAGVIGTKCIVSADYEWAGYRNIKYSEASDYGYYAPWYDWNDPWYWDYWGKPQAASADKSRAMPGSPRAEYKSPIDYANSRISETSRNTNTLRLGAEYRVTPSFSVRAGYSFVSSPFSSAARELKSSLPGTGLLSAYTMEDVTNYITCGLGYKSKGFYADIAYVYKHQNSTYVPFSPDVADPGINPRSSLSFNESKIALTLGYRF